MTGSGWWVFWRPWLRAEAAAFALSGDSSQHHNAGRGHSWTPECQACGLGSPVSVGPAGRPAARRGQAVAACTADTDAGRRRHSPHPRSLVTLAAPRRPLGRTRHRRREFGGGEPGGQHGVGVPDAGGVRPADSARAAEAQPPGHRRQPGRAAGAGGRSAATPGCGKRAVRRTPRFPPPPWRRRGRGLCGARARGGSLVVRWWIG